MMIDKNWDTVFLSRLEAYYDEIKWLYYEIYGNDEMALDYFCSMLHEFFVRRHPELKAWDQLKTERGAWYKNNQNLGMMLYVDLFAENLDGVRSHLDYIQECGVNYLHLMPLLESPTGESDGGYAVSDFRKISDELGSFEDLYELTKDCHSRGIVTCLDFVMNHTSREHEWAKHARNGEKDYQDRYFFFDTWDIPSEYEKTVPEVFPTTAPGNFTWVPEINRVVMTTFYPFQWDLNYANPVVFNDMTANMLHLCNHGVDIIRLDAVPYIWKQLGTNCRNLPQVHSLVRLMRLAVEIVCPGTLLLGEVVMEPEKVVPYFGNVEKPECNVLYNVTTMATTWHTVATRDVRLMQHQLGILFNLPREFIFQNYLRCHDDIGWGLDYGYLEQFGIAQVPHKKFLNDYLTGHWPGSDARGELYNSDMRLGDARLCGTTASLCGIEAAEYERDPKKLQRGISLDIMLHAFLMTQSGIPVLYSGDEIGQLNDYTYHDDPLRWEDSRQLHRGVFSWGDAEKRNDPSTRQYALFHALQNLSTLRKENAAFHGEADVWIIDTHHTAVLGIGRYYQGEKLVALFNFSEQDAVISIDYEEKYDDLIVEQEVDNRSVFVPGQSFRWLYHDFNNES